MRTSITAIILLVISTIGVGAGAPQPPVSPTSYAECNAYNSEFWAYSKQNYSIVQQCWERYHQLKGEKRWIDTRCSPIAMPEYCAKEIEEHDCNQEEYYAAMRECRAKVAMYTESQKTSISGSQDSLSAKLLATTATGVPATGTANTKRLAFFTADPPSAAPPNSYLARLNLANRYYSGLMKGLGAIDPTSTPHQKVGSSGKLMSQVRLGQRNILAQDLLDVSISGLVSTNEIALKKLEEDLAKISLNVGQSYRKEVLRANNLARSEADEKVNMRLSKDAEAEAAASRQVEEERVAAERAEIVAQQEADASIFNEEARQRADEYNGDGGHPDLQQGAYQACTDTYNKKFRTLPDHRALVGGANGKLQQCFWTYGYDDQASAINAALENCRQEYGYCIVYGTDSGTTAWSRMVSDHGGTAPGYVKNYNTQRNYNQNAQNMQMFQQLLSGMAGAMANRKRSAPNASSGGGGNPCPWMRQTPNGNATC